MTHRLLAGLEKKGCDAKRWCTTNKKINKCDSLPVCNSQVAVKNPWGLFQWLLSKMQPKRCQIQHKDQWFLRMPRLGHAPMKSSWCVNVSPLAKQPNKNQQVHLPKPAEAGGRTSGVVGKTSEARWLVSYLGGHWMEDKWPDKKRRWFVTVVWYFSPNSQVLPPPPPPPFGQDGFST